MKSFEAVKTELLELLPGIRKALESSGYSETESLEDYAEKDPSGLEWKVLEKALSLLERAIEPIEFVNRPIVSECSIKKNKAGYYEAENGKQFHAGSMIEALLSISEETEEWIYTRVEYSWNKRDYVLFPQSLEIPLTEVRRVRFRVPSVNAYPYG